MELFGNLDRNPGMENLLADLRHAFRVFRKSPGFTSIAIAALALGIGANTAIFSVINVVLLQPLPYPQPDRIMQIARKFPDGIGNSCSIPKFNAWKKNDVFESMAAYDFAGPGMNVGGVDHPEQVKASTLRRNSSGSLVSLPYSAGRSRLTRTCPTGPESP